MGMANGKASKQEDAPAALYGSFNDGGKKVVDNNATVCKHCAAHIVYAKTNKLQTLGHCSHVSSLQMFPDFLL